MKAIYKQLLDKSLGAALAAIEVYNKPDFKYREECFVILVVNAWELLFKAKLLKDAKNKLTTLYVHDGRRIRKSRTGIPLTIELLGAMRKLSVAQEVHDNLESLVEIRDTAVHFYNDDDLRYIVYTLGVAALKNYQELVRQWFKQSLAAYNFYIMPVGFSYNFQTLRMLDVKKSAPVVANLIKAVAQAQQRASCDGAFSFACEIVAELKSAKKFAAPADLTVKIDQGGTGAVTVITQTKKKLDQYPLSYTEFVAQIKKALPSMKLKDLFAVMKEINLKNDPTYADYSFRTKAQEVAYESTHKLPKGITSIYNQDAVRLVVERLKERTKIT